MTQESRRALRNAGTALMALALCGCMSTARPQPRPVRYPVPTGPYKVGLVSCHWTDTDRAGVLGDSAGVPREIVAYVYYPAAPDAEALPSPWLDDGQVAAVSAALAVAGPRFSAIQANSYRDAPVAPSEKPWPVLVFSHGNGESPMSYTALLEELASHGYVVIAVSHTGNAFVTVFPGGRVVKARSAGNPNPDRRPRDSGFQAMDSAWSRAGKVLSVIADDCLFAIDQAVELSRADPRFAGRIDASRVAVLGHSFGGAAAVECACRGDPRIVAAANLDGTLYADTAMAGLRVPYLLVTNEVFAEARRVHEAREENIAVLVGKGFTREQAVLSLDRIFAQWLAYLRSPVACFVMVSGSLHCNFCDYDVLAREFPEIPTFREDTGSMDPGRFREVTWPYIVSFLDRFVRGVPAALLASPSPYPEVTYESRGL